MITQRDWKQFGQYAMELGYIKDKKLINNAYYKQLGHHSFNHFGEHKPIGEILVEDGKLTVDQVSRIVEQQEVDRLDNLDPLSHFSPSTKFGGRLLDHVCDKKEIARLAALHFVRPNGKVFIADGTSGFYTFLAVARDIAPKGPVQVRTNSLAILMEYSQSSAVAANIEIVCACDTPNKLKSRNEYLAMVGKDEKHTEEALRAACRGSLAILPVSGISYDEGPFARDDRIRDIKRWVMESAARIVFLADYTKISKTAQEMRADQQRPVYEDAREWEKWRATPQWHLITSIHPRDVPQGLRPGAVDLRGAVHRTLAANPGQARTYHKQSQMFRVDRERIENGFVEIVSFYDDVGNVSAVTSNNRLQQTGPGT